MHFLADTPIDSLCFLRYVSYLVPVLPSFFPRTCLPCISYCLKLSLVIEAYAIILNNFIVQKWRIRRFIFEFMTKLLVAKFI